MKTRICILLIIVAACTVSTFGQVMTPERDDESTSNQMCLDCDGGGGGGWSGSSSYDQGQYLDNPCTAVQDWVYVDYQAYVQGAQQEAGVARYLFDESTNVAGSYAASGSAQSDVGYGATFTQRYYHKVNTYDNFHVVTVVTFTPGSNTTTVGVETACGNGMPDSAQ
jgi:hypothetical protein